MSYLTGRQRTIHWSGDLQGIADQTTVEHTGYFTPPGDAGTQKARSGSVTIEALEADLGIFWPTIAVLGTNSNPNEGVGCPNGHFPMSSDIEISVSTGLVTGTPSDTDSVSSVLTSCGSTSLGGSAGSWSIALDVEEMFDVAAIVDIDADGFPDYGGTAAKDGPPGEGITFRERAKIGGNLVVSASLGGASATATSPIDITNQFTITDYKVRIEAEAGAYGTAGSSLWGATGVFTNEPLGLSSYSYSTPSGTASAVSGGICSVIGPGAIAGTQSASISAQLWPPLRYALEVFGRSFELPYSKPMTVRWQHKNTSVMDWYQDVACNPDGSAVVEQKRYGISSTINGAAQPNASINEQGLSRAWLLGTALSANGDDTRDWRCLIHGKAYNSFTLQHANTVLDNGSSAANWSGNAYTTVTQSGGDVVLTIGAGGTGKGTVTPGTAWNLEHFRYLRLNLKADATRTVDIKIGSKTWTITLTNSYADYDLDLCCATNASFSVDGQDTRWPETSSVNTTPQNEGPGWGVNRIATLDVDSIPISAVVYVNSITAVKNARANINFQPGFKVQFEAFPDVGGTHIERFPFGITEVDYRISDIAWYLAATTTTPPGTTVYTWRTLTQLIAQFAAETGLSATAVGSFPADGFHNNSRYNYWAGGAGYVYSLATDPPLDPYINRSISSSVTVVAQAMWDEVMGYPGIGDAWTGGSYPALGDGASIKALPVRIIYQLRGQAWGTVHKLTQVPQLGATVKAHEAATPANIAGSGATGSLGGFFTGQPRGKGNVSHGTELQVAPLPFLDTTDTWANRWRARAAFRRTIGADAAGIHSTHDLRRGWSFHVLYGGGNLQLLRRRERAQEIFDVDGTLDAQSAQVALHRWGWLLVVYVEDGVPGTQLVVSKGDELDWSAPVAIGSGTATHCAICTHPSDGTQWMAEYNTDGWDLYRRAQLIGAFEFVVRIVNAPEAQAGIEWVEGPIKGLVFSYPDGAGVSMLRSMNRGDDWVAV